MNEIHREKIIDCRKFYFYDFFCVWWEKNVHAYSLAGTDDCINFLCSLLKFNLLFECGTAVFSIKTRNYLILINFGHIKSTRMLVKVNLLITQIWLLKFNLKFFWIFLKIPIPWKSKTYEWITQKEILIVMLRN